MLLLQLPVVERWSVPTFVGGQVTMVGGTQVAPTGCPVYNPAFDVTPARFITGIVTGAFLGALFSTLAWARFLRAGRALAEEGVCHPPYGLTLRAAKEAAERRMREVRRRARGVGCCGAVFVIAWCATGLGKEAVCRCCWWRA